MKDEPQIDIYAPPPSTGQHFAAAVRSGWIALRRPLAIVGGLALALWALTNFLASDSGPAGTATMREATADAQEGAAGRSGPAGAESTAAVFPTVTILVMPFANQTGNPS